MGRRWKTKGKAFARVFCYVGGPPTLRFYGTVSSLYTLGVCLDSKSSESRWNAVMFYMWGGTPPPRSILLLNNDRTGAKTDLMGLEHKRNPKSSPTDKKVHLPPATMAAWCRRAVPELQLDLFFLFSGRWWRWQLGGVGFWLQITGCVHRTLKAKQRLPSSSVSTLAAPFMLSMPGPWSGDDTFNQFTLQ